MSLEVTRGNNLSNFGKVLYSVLCVRCCAASIVRKSKSSFTKKTNVLFLSARPLPTDPQQIQILQNLLRSLEAQRNVPGVGILCMRQRK